MKLMMDIMVLALWSDTTRIDFMTADAQTNETSRSVTGVRAVPLHFAPRRGSGTQNTIRNVRDVACSQVALLLNRLKSLD